MNRTPESDRRSLREKTRNKGYNANIVTDSLHINYIHPTADESVNTTATANKAAASVDRINTSALEDSANIRASQCVAAFIRNVLGPRSHRLFAI